MHVVYSNFRHVKHKLHHNKHLFITLGGWTVAPKISAQKPTDWIYLSQIIDGNLVSTFKLLGNEN